MEDTVSKGTSDLLSDMSNKRTEHITTMGKKRIIRKSGGTVDAGLKSRALARVAKKNIVQGTLHIHATYNNTKVLLSDKGGNAVAWSSSGSLGFSGAKKGTPFAAAKVG